MTPGGNLPPVDLGYVRDHCPELTRLAQRYRDARAAFIASRIEGAEFDRLRATAEALRDQLKAAHDA